MYVYAVYVFIEFFPSNFFKDKMQVLVKNTIESSLGKTKLKKRNWRRI